MRRWFVSDNSVKSVDFIVQSHNINYDDVVDRSCFRPDSEQVRQFVSNGVGSSGVGVYDDPDNMPSDLEVRIRSGKLDKAEVSQLILKESDNLKKLSSEKAKAAELDKVEKISKARQEFLDSKTGFTGAKADS